MNLPYLTADNAKAINFFVRFVCSNHSFALINKMNVGRGFTLEELLENKEGELDQRILKAGLNRLEKYGFVEQSILEGQKHYQLDESILNLNEILMLMQEYEMIPKTTEFPPQSSKYNK